MTDFINNGLLFICIMLLFYMIGDYFIIPKSDPRVRTTIITRWIFSTLIGFIALYSLYSRAGP